MILYKLQNVQPLRDRKYTVRMKVAQIRMHNILQDVSLLSQVSFMLVILKWTEKSTNTT